MRSSYIKSSTLRHLMMRRLVWWSFVGCGTLVCTRRAWWAHRWSLKRTCELAYAFDSDQACCKFITFDFGGWTALDSQTSSQQCSYQSTQKSAWSILHVVGLGYVQLTKTSTTSCCSLVKVVLVVRAAEVIAPTTSVAVVRATFYWVSWRRLDPVLDLIGGHTY